MTFAGLIPSEIGTAAVIAICTIAFVAGASRGFSGFGAALIFMPLASSVAPPRLAAALLLIIDLVSAAPLIPNAWREADRKATMIMVAGSAVTIPIGTYFLTRLDPIATRWILSALVAALLLLLLSGWRYRGKDHATLSIAIGAVSGFCSGIAQTGGPPIVGYWLGRPIAAKVARANILLFFGAADVFGAISYATGGLITLQAIGFSLIVGPVYALAIWLGAKLFGCASEKLFRAICYVLIALAVIIGLPTLDGVIR
jgi:uncharacterized membrane protein YfcA